MGPISATGTRGFTLVEILAVVAIAGVILALAAVNLLPSDAEVARRESGLLALAIEGARDEAWFGGRPTAISIDGTRARQWRLDADRRWQSDTQRDRPLGPGVRVTGLFVDGQALESDARLIFLPDGFGVPFRLTVEIRGLVRAIEGDAAGAVRVTL